MQGVLLYTLAIAAAVSAVAFGLDQLAASNGRPRRFVWMLAMLLSILLPGAMLAGAALRLAPPAFVAVPIVMAEPSYRESQAEELPAMAMQPATSSAAADPVLQPMPSARWHWQLPGIDTRTFLMAWAGTSGILLVLLTAMCLRLGRRARSWARESLGEQDVLVSDDAGPALLGVLWPRMVVPRWFLEEPAGMQALILEHERQHMLARDPLLLRAAVLAAILVPWNLPLWWQLRHLRLAIELDCDARVLRGGADAAEYAEVLLGVVQRATAMPAGVIAMSEPASALERRIGNLLSGPRRLALLGLAGASMLAVGGIALMVALDAPLIPRTLADRIGTPAAANSADTLPDPGATQYELALPYPPEIAGPVDEGQRVSNARPSTNAPTAEAGRPRLLPPSASLVPEQVMRALVQQYPELMRGPEQAGITEAAIVLKPDGTLYRSALRAPLPQEPNGSVEGLSEILPRDAGALTTALLRSGTDAPGGGTFKSTVALRYGVLPDNYDESRSVEAVQAAMVAAHPELLLPRGGDRVNRVTVYLTDDGRVDRYYNEVRLMTELQPVPPVEAATWSPIFQPLGVRPEQLGRMGMTYVYGDADRSTWMIVRYGWPRREGEPTGGFQAATISAAAPDTFDSAAALAVVQHYLPEAFTRREPLDDFGEPPPDPGIPAVALGSQGQVLLATHVPAHHGVSPDAVRALQEQLPPGARLSRFVARPVRNAEGAGTTVLFAWNMLAE